MIKPQKSNPSLFVIYWIAFSSGASCLIFELTWSRYLSLVFGASIYAISCVTACFMMGLALGSWIIGKLSDHYPNNNKIFGWLMAGLGIYSLLTPVIFWAMMELTKLALQNVYGIDYLRNLLRIGFSFLILIVPTFLMGGTFPLIIKVFNGLRGRDIHSVGKEAAGIYAINTLGGVVGTFCAGFILIRFMGIKNTNFLASALILLNAGLLFFFRLRLDIQDTETKAKQKPVVLPGHETQSYSQKVIFLTLMAFGISGFTSLAYEVLWTKILVLFFRDSIYDFTIVLTAFLSGTVLGSYFCGKFIHRSKNPLLPFALFEVLIGIFALLSLYFIEKLPYVSVFLQSMHALEIRYGANYWLIANVIRFGYAFSVMLIPTSLMGAVFPLVIRIRSGKIGELGQNIGLTNSVNTIGATLGSLFAGFIFISLIGIQKSIILMAICNIGIGIILLSILPLRNLRRKALILSASFFITLLTLVFIPRWDKLRMSVYLSDPALPVERVLSLNYYHEDAYGITSVVEFKPDKIKILTTNRLYSQNTSAMMGLEDHRRLGHIPLLLHPNPQSALVVGLGAGISMRGVSEHHLRTIDCVEISSGVLQAARYFTKENAGVIDNPEIHYIIDDGRNYISVTRKKYDVIIGDILFPMSSGSSNMFSKEYFELCKKRLQKGGLMCQWLPVHQISLDEMKIILRTFKTVFPSVSIWYGMLGGSVPVIGCIGMDNQFTIDFQSLEQKYQDPKLAGYLQESNLDNPSILLSNFIMAGATVDLFTAGSMLNTDDHPVIEFINPKLASGFQERGLANLKTFSETTEDVTPYLTNVRGGRLVEEQIRNKVRGCVFEVKNIIEGLEFP